MCWLSSSLGCRCMLAIVMSWLLSCFGHRHIFLFVVSCLSSCFSCSKMEYCFLLFIFCAYDHQTDIRCKHVKTVSIYSFLTTILQQPRRNTSEISPVFCGLRKTGDVFELFLVKRRCIHGVDRHIRTFYLIRTAWPLPNIFCTLHAYIDVSPITSPWLKV